MKKTQFFFPTLFICLLAFTITMAHSPAKVGILSPTVSTRAGSSLNVFTVPPGSLDYYYTSSISNGMTICQLALYDLGDVSFSCVIDGFTTTRSSTSFTYFENSPVWRQANFTITGAGGVADVQVQWGTSYQVSVSVHWH